MHTHLGEYPGHIKERFARDALAAWPNMQLGTTLDAHYEATEACDRVVALGFCAPSAGWVVPNDYVADYVKRDPKRIIGFGSVDPNDPEAPAEVERMREDLGLLGCKLGPIYQDVHPLSAGFLRVCSTLQRLEMPLIIHQGATFVQSGPLIHSMPILIDELARIHPELRIVVTHMGHPWIEDTIVVTRKQPNVYADVSAIHPRPWQLYHALLAASEYRAVDKLVFGSDYPFMGVEETIQGLRNVNEIVRGTNLPKISEDVIEQIIYRPTLDLLGIE